MPNTHQNLLDWYISQLEEKGNQAFADQMRLLDRTINESTYKSVEETFSFKQLETFLDELLTLAGFIDVFGPGSELSDGSRFQVFAYQDGAFIPSGERDPISE